MPQEQDWPAEIVCQILHRAYMRWCDRHGFNRFKKTAQQLGIELVRLCTEIRRGRPNRKGSEKRPRVYHLPSLGNCRWRFEMMLHTTIDWDTGLARSGAVPDEDGGEDR